MIFSPLLLLTMAISFCLWISVSGKSSRSATEHLRARLDFVDRDWIKAELIAIVIGTIFIC